MKCQVCSANYANGDSCPQCGNGPFEAGDAEGILRARQAFMEKSTAYAPNSRVSFLEKLKPWIAVVLGFLLFLFWLRACSTLGTHIF